MVSLGVLGPVQVDGAAGSLAPRDRLVLAVLVVRRGQEVDAATLADALWGDRPPSSAQKVVQGCVHRLRGVLGAGAIITGQRGYRLVASGDDVDADRFERLVHRAQDMLRERQGDRAAFLAAEALGLWRGRPLAELEEWEPGRHEAERLEELRLLAEEVRLEGGLAAGRASDLVPDATLAVREQPLRERRWVLLARAQYQSGRQADALSTLRGARRMVSEELGLDPDLEIVELERAILAQDPSLSVELTPEASPVCPFPGLVPYDVGDAEGFFGRETEIRECLERLERVGVLVVVGPSGSGKSSLIRAGVAAALRREGRRVHLLTPGTRPSDALPQLDARGPRPVIVVDQAEELFTLVSDDAPRAEFFGRLAEHVRAGGSVVVALRADRIGDLARYPSLTKQVEAGLYLLGMMSEDALRRTIEIPARQAGLVLEQGLTDLLIRDVVGEPGALPLLGHALRVTWERREGKTLTVAGYRASGGIRGAIAQSAETLYEAATPEQRRSLRELLLRMVQPGPSGEPVRTPASRESLVTDGAHAALVEQLVQARLVTAGQDRLQIAHEALAGAWPRLQGWLADDVEGQRIRHHLSATAEAWDAMQRPVTELYRGARLVRTLEWRNAGSPSLSGVERDFLAASEEEHAGEQRRAAELIRRQRRDNRRLRGLVAVVSVLAVVAASFATSSVVQADRAEAAAARARSQELAASAHSVAQVGDPTLAKALAVAAAEAAPPNHQTRAALHRAFFGDPVIARVSMLGPVGRLWAVLNPQGDRVAMTGESIWLAGRSIVVVDARTGDKVWEYRIPDQPGYESHFIAGAAYTPDGRHLVAGVALNPTYWMRIGPEPRTAPADLGIVGIQVWDARTHELVRRLDVGPCGGWPVEAAGGQVLVKALVAPAEGLAVTSECRWGDAETSTEVIELATGARQRVSTTESAWEWSTTDALSDDGLVAASSDPETQEIVVFDVRRGREARHEGQARDLDPTGRRLLVWLTDEYRIIDIATGAVLTTFRGHEGHSLYAQFTHDGTAVLSTGVSGDLRVWDAADGRQTRVVQAVGEGRPTIADNGTVVVARPTTYGASLLDLGLRGEVGAWTACTDGFVAADQLRLADGKILFGGDCPTTVGTRADGVDVATHVISPDTGEVTRRTGPFTQAFEVSPDGTQLLVQDGSVGEVSDFGGIEIRDLATDEVVRTLEGLCSLSADDRGECAEFPSMPFLFNAWRVRWSPDGRWIAAVDLQFAQRAAVWAADSGRLVSVLPATQSYPEDLLFSQDSTRLFVTYGSGNIVAFDTTSWQEVASGVAVGAGGSAVGLVGQARDGRVVGVAPYRRPFSAAQLVLFDPDTLDVVRTLTRIADTSIRAAAISPDGTRVALGGFDGTTTIWDLATFTLVDEIALGRQIQGVAWLDDSDLALALWSGSVVAVTTDPDALVQTVRASIVRGLREAECTTYGFIDNCPRRHVLRRDAAPADPLVGTFSVTWLKEEILQVMQQSYTEAFGGPLSQTSLDELEVWAGDVAGEYRVEFSGTSYRITKDGGTTPFCTGSLATEGGQLTLGADEGTWCLDFHYFGAAYSLEGDTLTLDADAFQGPDLDRFLWTSKPLARVP